MSELKKCPFCGGKPNEYDTVADNPFDETDYTYRIICECLVNPVCYVSTVNEIEYGNLKKKAIKAWNTRVDNSEQD